MTKGSGMISRAWPPPWVRHDRRVHPTGATARHPEARRRTQLQRLSVDGDTSTNDTLVLLANGASGVRPDPASFPKWKRDRTRDGVAAQAIARDGEGARKFITIVVSGASNNDGAVRMARAIANSPW